MATTTTTTNRVARGNLGDAKVRGNGMVSRVTCATRRRLLPSSLRARRSLEALRTCSSRSHLQSTTQDVGFFPFGLKSLKVLKEGRERRRRSFSCRAEGEGASSGGGGGGSTEGGFSLPWQKKKGGEGGGGGTDDSEEALNKPNIFIRVVSACMYFIPWIDAQQLSNYFYDQWSVLLPLYMVPAWPARLYCITPMAPLIWFFMLFSLVIRNKRLPHFLRFHTMQAMMTDIVVMLFGLTRQSLPYYVAGSWVDAVLSQYAFLCALLTVIWCIWKTIEGYYVELPFVSEAVYIQLSIADMM
mmetsp:Transcript_1548/g.2579  ORF Transcript_1548/g.2579 Transcript_1548/m.2579 type:complete len:299 (+) Transcript_1548:26-922(+)